MIKIISSGTVLESIAVTFDTSNVYPVNELESWEEDKGKKERRSIYHKLFVELEHLVGDPNSAAQEIKQNVVEFDESLQGVQVGIGVALTTGNTDLLVSASAVAAENFGEIFTGDDERARRDLNDVATATGRALLQDPTFKAEYDKVIGGGSMTYRGTQYSWTKEKPLSQYNEEKVVPYLRKKFGKYGLKFTETGWGSNMVNITVKGDASRSEDFDLNTLTPQGSRKETYNIMDYIVENGKLPGN